MKKSKKVLFIVLSVLIILSIIFWGYISLDVKNDLKEEDLIKNEINLISDLIEKNGIWDTSVDHRLNSIVTKDEYRWIEKSIKNYYKDYITLSRDLLNSYNYDAIYKLFDIDNYIIDGPDFNKSLDYLDSKESTCLKLYSDLKDMLNKDVILSYLDNDIDEYYKDFYNELMIDNNSDILNDLESEEKEYETFISSVKDVFNYLKTNKDKWEIDDYQIYFDGQVLADEYNQLLDKVTYYESDFKQNI